MSLPDKAPSAENQRHTARPKPPRAAAPSGSVPGTTVIVTGPQGVGKTVHARAIAKHFGCGVIVEDWSPTSRVLRQGALHLTNVPMEGPHFYGALVVQFQELALQLRLQHPGCTR